MPKTKWRTIVIEDAMLARAIESTWAGGKAFRGDKFTFAIEHSGGSTEIETNLPIAELRRLFSFSGVPFPRDYITADEPSWEIYKDVDPRRRAWDK